MKVRRYSEHLGLAAVLVRSSSLFSSLSDHFFSRITFTTLPIRFRR